MEKQASTRNLILENSIKLFAAKGFDAVGVQEICTQSEITKPTLYYYFESKAGLLLAIIDYAGTEMLKRLTLDSEYVHDFQGSLEKILLGQIQFAKEYPDFYKLHVALENASAQSESAKLYKSFSEKEEDLFQNFFKSSVAEIGNMKGKEILFSRIFQKICTSTATDIISGRFKKKDDVIYSIVHAFIYGVVAG